MNSRIVQLRKSREWTQDKFAEEMGISKNYVSLIENGKKIPSDRLITDICQEFNVNEEWLRTGKGEPTIKRTKNQEIQAFANDVMNLPDESLKKRLIEGLAKLNADDWEKILEIAEKLLSESKKEEGE